MGTQGAWGGSGGRPWGRVRREVSELLDSPSTDAAEALLPALGDAMDWLDTEGETDPAAPSEDRPAASPQMTPLPVRPSWAEPAVGGRGGGGRGGQASGRQSHGAGGSRSSTGAGRRSRTRAASVGGQVLAAGLAYRRGDAAALRELGLDLGELQSLSSARRMNRILNAIVGADGGIEETELRAVNSRVLRQMLVDEISGPDAVRLYIVEYVMQVYVSEAGEAMRDGSRPGQASVEAERQLRGVLRTRVRQLELPDQAVSAAELRDAIHRFLGLMRRLMRGR